VGSDCGKATPVQYAHSKKLRRNSERAVTLLELAFGFFKFGFSFSVLKNFGFFNIRN
jgi:hypothetical protein